VEENTDQGVFLFTEHLRGGMN